MATPDDRRAATVLLALVALGFALRLVVSGSDPLGGVAFRAALGERPSVDSVAAQAARFMRPLERDETVDLDRATAAELVRLPRIGPALAARIVRDRETRGGFGSLAALDRVPGVGPTVLDAIRPHAVFTAERSSARALVPPGSRPVPPLLPASAVSLNSASEEELARLPGIGPVRARAIVQYRRVHGRFRSLDDLARVRGIGPVTVERLRGRVRIP